MSIHDLAIALLVGCYSTCLIAGAATGDDSRAAAYPRDKMLVEPASLSSAATRSGIVLLDVRDAKAYAAGHATGALRADPQEWAKAFGDGDDAGGWSKRIAALGIDAKSKVVIYDDAMSKDAARAWWILRYWGVEGAALLNGGWAGWRIAKLPVTADAPTSPTPTSFKAIAADKRLATKGKLLKAVKGGDVKSGKVQIVDARSEGEFCGTDALKNKHAGAIPGALHLEWVDLMDRPTGRFKSAAELKRAFAATGIDVTKPTATHCQGGGRAAVMAFGLELMGASDVSNYYKSWQEWGNADDTPIEPGAKKAK